MAFFINSSYTVVLCGVRIVGSGWHMNLSARTRGAVLGSARECKRGLQCWVERAQWGRQRRRRVMYQIRANRTPFL